MSKRVLIVTYYWPPSAGSGVQRWLKFAKYLPEYDWEPVIFTPENPDFELKDESLAKEVDPAIEVLKFPIWEPYDLFRKLKKEKIKDTAQVLEKKKKSWTDRLGIWVRANLLIPDPRIFWVKPSVDFLSDLIKKGQFDALITTGPPHSLHLIGRNLKRKTGIKWLADFRDPWTEWEFLDTLPMHSLSKRKHRKLETSVLQEADRIITISPTFQNELGMLGNRKITLLTNGFDPKDLPEGWNLDSPLTDHLEIVYTGVIDAIRNPIPFLLVLKEAYGPSGKKVSLSFVGKVSEGVHQFIQEDDWLRDHVVLAGYVSHEKVFDYYRKANLLLLILTDTKNAKGNIPGKLFEYMATGRPILALGDPKGDSAKILTESGAGKVYSHSDSAGMKDFLLDFIPGNSQTDAGSVGSYSRKKLTQQLAKLLDETIDSLS
jgi:glycosyltransferase involved in cell wall biosynthesis